MPYSRLQIPQGPPRQPEELPSLSPGEADAEQQYQSGLSPLRDPHHSHPDKNYPAVPLIRQQR